MINQAVVLVALVVIVGLCQGAAIEKGDESAAEEASALSERKKLKTDEKDTAEPPTAIHCKLSPEHCRSKKQEEKQEIPVPYAICQGKPASLCGRKKREAKPESPIQPAGTTICNGKPASSLCGRKRREVKLETPMQPSGIICNGKHASLCGGKK